MRVATYNVHDCIGRDGQFSPQRTANILLELRAEVVAVQEVTLDRAGVLLEHFQVTTGLCAIDGTVLDRGAGRYGNLLLLRHGTTAWRLHDLSVGAYEPRAALEVRLDVEGQPITVFATHLGLARRERRVQIARLAKMIADIQVPTVLLGDLNVWCGTRELRPLLERGYQHLRVRSFPTRWLPLVPLDRIFAGPRALIRRCWRHDTPLSRVASDHFPIVAEIQTTR